MAEFNYSQLGLTRELLSNGVAATQGWPEGYRRVFERVQLGRGEATFQQLSAGIINWGIQRGAGLRPRSEGPAVLGMKVVCGFGIGPLRLPVPCQVLWSEQTDQLSGFGYGTLPGHPARGEEAFVAELADDGGVWFSVLAFSKPSPGIFALTAPASRLMQGLVTRKYLAAAKALVE